VSNEDDNEPKVVITPTMQAQMDADPEMAGAVREALAQIRQGMQAVKDGRYKDIEEAMSAVGIEARPIDDDQFDDEIDDLPIEELRSLCKSMSEAMTEGLKIHEKMHRRSGDAKKMIALQALVIEKLKDFLSAKGLLDEPIEPGAPAVGEIIEVLMAKNE
jgi:hypothetical protein